MFIRLILLVTSLLLLNSCISGTSLNKEAYQHIQTVDHILLIPQSNLAVKKAMSFLPKDSLVEIVTSKIVETVEHINDKELASPLIDELENFDFRKAMLDATVEQIKKTNESPFKINPRYEIFSYDQNKRIYFAKSKADVVLFSRVRYEYVSGDLIITAHVEMFPKDLKVMKQYMNANGEGYSTESGNIIYEKHYSYTKDNITLYNLIKSVNEGVKRIAHQTITELTHPN